MLLTSRFRVIVNLHQVVVRNVNCHEPGSGKDFKPVGEGIMELRIDYGSGYRIYFAQSGVTIILLLCGGDKSTQSQDIFRAKQYWTDFQKRQNANP